MDKKNASAATEAEKVIDKKFVQEFENGTSVKFHYSIELTNFSEKDFREILSFIAANARNFYLYVAENINNKP